MVAAWSPTWELHWLVGHVQGLVGFKDYEQMTFQPNCMKERMWCCKGAGKRGHIVADTLLPMKFSGLRKLGNICCRHRMFLNKIRNIFCVPDTKFVSATNVARGQTGKHLCRQQCVPNNVSSFARTLSNCILKYCRPSRRACRALQAALQKNPCPKSRHMCSGYKIHCSPRDQSLSV